VLRNHYIDANVSMTNMYVSMAEGYAASRVSNGKRLNERMRVFRAACVALGVDVVLWLVGIRG
jgi:hypothetical protein